MIHYTCDCCKRPLNPETETRYLVRVEVYATPVNSDSTVVEQRDHLEEIQEILEHLENHGPSHHGTLNHPGLGSAEQPTQRQQSSDDELSADLSSYDGVIFHADRDSDQRDKDQRNTAELDEFLAEYDEYDESDECFDVEFEDFCTFGMESLSQAPVDAGLGAGKLGGGKLGAGEVGSDDTLGPIGGDGLHQQLRFDLCHDCRQRFLRNPMGKTVTPQFGFSQN